MEDRGNGILVPVRLGGNRNKIGGKLRLGTDRVVQRHRR